MRTCRALLIVVAVVVAALAIGCSRDDTILSVNGWSLGRQDFLVELDQVATNQGYLAARRQNGQAFKVFKDGSTNEYTPEFVAELLNERVTFRLAEAEVASRKLTVTDDDRAKAIDVISAGFTTGADPASTTPGSTPGPPGSTPGSAGSVASGRAVLDSFGSYRDVLVDGVANLQVLRRSLSADITGDEQLQSLYEQVRDSYGTQACVRHILVKAGANEIDPTTGNAIPGTDEQYAAALDRLLAIKGQLDGGADFATVASQSSEDAATQAKGGDLGCAPKGQYAGAFEDAVWSQPVGAVSAPIKSTFGYHLLLVTDRRTKTFDEMKGQLRQAVEDQSQQTLQQWLTTATKDAKVTVDPQFGRWNASTGTIDPAGTGSSLSLVPEQPGTTVIPADSPSSEAPAVPLGSEPAAGGPR